MSIKHVCIERFRGIEHLDWRLDGRVICLVGPNDVGKTTILDAIEYVLAPRWTLQLTDDDFYNGDCSHPIEIALTLGGIPDELRAEGKFGLNLRGWSDASGLRDEPEDDDERVLTIRLRVDQSLEPEWAVINDRLPEEGRPISWRDRESLRLFRVGDDIDRHFYWKRGSALTRVMVMDGPASRANVAQVIADGFRAARNAVAEAAVADLQAAVARAQSAVEQMGVAVAHGYQIGLTFPQSVGASALAILDGNVPLEAAGLGTRRLAALAIQALSQSGSCVALIDEIEHGLEPHRIRHLLHLLVRWTEAEPPPMCQVLFATHSPAVLREMNAEHLRVVRKCGGRATVEKVPSSLQRTVRSVPEALLSKSVVVCEGNTEAGFCRGLEAHWAANHDGVPIAHKGTEIAVCAARSGGSAAASTAHDLARLGYRVALFADGDRALSPTAAELQASGVYVVQWANGVSTEERVCADLPWPAVKRLVALAIENRGEEIVLDALRNRGVPAPTSDVDSWITEQCDESAVRAAVAMSAKRIGWFKTIDAGQRIGEILAECLPAIGNSDLATKTELLERWVYA